jgi:hypothetical protein
MYYNIKELVAIRLISIRNWNYLHTLDDNFLFGFCKNRTLNHKFPTECGRWQNMNLFIYMYSKSRFLCVFWRIVKARIVDRALHNVFCIVTLSIAIYVDNICIRVETDQKSSPKILISSVIVSVLASSAVDRGFESRSGQTKDYQLVCVAYNAKHAELGRKSKDWLPRNQDNVSEWSDMYICGLLFPLANTKKKTKRVGLEKSGHHHHLINLVSPWYSYKIAELALNNNRSLTKAVTYSFYISPTMYVYCVYSAMSYS